ncbi:MAG: LysM peptidoglycan-binding domain-containing protein [Cyclobacteriaceae bacterium]
MIKLVFLVSHLWASPMGHVSDSLRMETVNGKSFIIHRVDEQETLYGISRRYGVPMTQILEFNKEADAGLEVGQILRVPYIPRVPSPPQQVKGVHTVAAGETLFSISRQYGLTVDEIKSMNNMPDNSISVGQQLNVAKAATTVTINQPTTANTMVGYHTVAPKETLFSISRQYGITVQELKEWNNMTTTNLEIGQLVRVVKPEVLVTQNVVDSTKKVETVVTPRQETVVKISENVAGTDEVKESGLAELIEGTEGNRKYLALHRTAKPGTILKVRNELNNREVFVRVVGPIPATSINDRLVIKISKSAFDRLGAIDQKFRVEVTYYK